MRELEKFNLILQNKVSSNYSGQRISTHGGTGLIFKDFTTYSRGDDFRKIDWKLYARTEKYYLRRYEEERNLTLHIVLDASSSMSFGTLSSKFEYASKLALGYAFIAFKNNEKFVLSTFSDDLTLFKPSKGTNQLINILDHLNGLKIKGQSNFLNSLLLYKKRIFSKSLIVILSDFLFNIDDIDQVLALYKNNEIVLVQILDKTEARLDIDGEYLLTDEESNTSVKTYVSNRLKKRYKNNLQHFQKDLSDICDKYGIKFLKVSNEKDIFDVFYELFHG